MGKSSFAPTIRVGGVAEQGGGTTHVQVFFMRDTCLFSHAPERHRGEHKRCYPGLKGGWIRCKRSWIHNFPIS